MVFSTFPRAGSRVQDRAQKKAEVLMWGGMGNLQLQVVIIEMVHLPYTDIRITGSTQYLTMSCWITPKARDSSSRHNYACVWFPFHIQYQGEQLLAEVSM